MPTLAESIGVNIRKHRLARGLTQEQLGEQAGLDFTTIGAAERGTRNLSIESLVAVAKALNAPIGELVETSPRKPTEKEHKLELLTRLMNRATVDDIELVTQIARLVTKR